MQGGIPDLALTRTNPVCSAIAPWQQPNYVTRNTAAQNTSQDFSALRASSHHEKVKGIVPAHGGEGHDERIEFGGQAHKVRAVLAPEQLVLLTLPLGYL